eukprot:1473265-Prymnesium_polylepis.1
MHMWPKIAVFECPRASTYYAALSCGLTKRTFDIMDTNAAGEAPRVGSQYGRFCRFLPFCRFRLVVRGTGA